MASGMEEISRGWDAPDPELLRKYWETATFAVDANVLLNAYRYSSATRKDLLEALASFGDRLWLPYQAAEEFGQNRLRVLLEQRTAKAKLEAVIQKAMTGLVEELEATARAIARRDVALYGEAVRDGFKDVKRRVLLTDQEHHEGLGEGEHRDDPLYGKIIDLFDEKIGPEFDEVHRGEILVEAERRLKEEIPPGYLDSDKPIRRRFGDILLWFQLMEHAERTALPVVLVTDDRKEDWRWVEKGQVLGPRPELVREMHQESGQGFHLYSPGAFVRLWKKSEGEVLAASVLEELDAKDHPSSEDQDSEPAIVEALENLSYRERRIMELLHGLANERPRSVAEIAQVFNISEDRVVQIAHQSLMKLQSLAEAQKLRDLP